MAALLKPRVVPRPWIFSCAEVGGMVRAGKSPTDVAKELDLGLQYTADLIDLYVGCKTYPEIFQQRTYQQAKARLKTLRHEELRRKLGEMP